MNYNQKYTFILIAILIFTFIGNNILIDLVKFENKTYNNNLNFKRTNNISLNTKTIFSQYRHCGDGICQPTAGENLLNCPQDCFYI